MMRRSEIEAAIILANNQSRANSVVQKWKYACAILKNWRAEGNNAILSRFGDSLDTY